MSRFTAHRYFQRSRRTIHQDTWKAPPTGAPQLESCVDRDLVEAAQRGDQAAFVDLVRTRGDRLFAVAQRILRDVDRAEDALQDALVIAWRDLRSLRDPDRFDAWVHRLLTNICIEQARRERRRVANLRVLDVEPSTAIDDLLTVGDRDQLDRAFRRLVPEERAILVLRFYLGYEPTEIAEVLGQPAGTIRSRLHHATRAMRAALDADARLIAVGGTSR
ncbi:MAG TPA: RNA polymerase sigma factor [Candidatus Limnocylindria bacterium]|nr:RNA polymerase sigma factor [Candidatus Limnocylindria bacterium]